MDTLNRIVKDMSNMTPASELRLFDTGGHLMNKAKWKNKEERRNRKNEINISVITKARNRAGQCSRDYKPTKPKEL